VTFSNIFENRIILNESRDYKHLTIKVYVLTGIALFYSSLPWIIVIILWTVLLLQLRKVWIFPRPTININTISIKNESWLLHDNIIGEVEYEEAISLIDTALFQLIAFSDATKARKLMLLFNDQLKTKDLYALRRRLVT
jgi:hypothetical protein